MKKIIFMFALGMAFLGLSGQASAAWNTYPSDCPFPLTIGNYTTGAGIQDGSNGCWTKKSVSASAGQTINVAVYYDNTNNANANNVVIKLSQSPAGSMTSKNSSYSFSGNLSSSVGGLTLSQVTASLSSSETLTFSRAKWYKKTDTSGVSLPGGQTGYEAFNGGLDMGTIANGDWGTILFSFTIGTTVQPPSNCTISNFNANPTSITSGGSSNLSWATTNCTSATISSVGNVNLNGTKSVSPTNTTTYTLNATGSNGSTDSKNVTINVTPPVNNCTASLTASTSSITLGGSTTLSWNTSNCSSATIYPTLGNVSINGGSQSVSPTSDTIYTLTAYGTNGQVVKTVFINVGIPPSVCSINSFTASPTSITSGGSSTLNWNTSNCTSATISSVGSVNTNGSKSVWPTSTLTFTLTAYGTSGVAQTRNVTVAVGQPSVCSINSFTASPTSITSGGSSTLSWNTTDCTTINILGIGNVSASGSQAIYPTQTTTYTITAYGSAGSTQTRNATVSVNQPSVCSISSFNASLTSINSGGSSILSWATTDCTSASISSLGNVSTNGAQTVWPTSTTTYVLTAYGTNGAAQSRSVTVFVNSIITNICDITNFSASDTSIDNGDSTTLRWDTTDCERVKISYIGSVADDGTKRVYPDEDITYVLTAYDQDGSSETESLRIYVDDEDNNDYYYCNISSFTASNNYVTTGGNVRLNWNTSNCNNVIISNIGNVYSTGSQVVYPVNTTNYVLTAYGTNGGIQTRSVLVTVNPYITPIVTPIYNNCAVTTVATNINQSGAQLNGIITGATGANTYFEYGTTVNLGQRTSSRYINSNTNFSEMVTGLAPNTIYFFRMVSDCSNGMSQGSVEIFRTLNVQNYNNNVVNNRPIVIQGTTVIGTSSPVMLKISNRYELIGQGDLIDYVVNYKNIGKDLLTRPMVQVVLPTNVTLINSSRGTYSIDTHTLSAQIEDLYPGQEGVIFLQGRVDTIPLNNSQIATTAILIYTSSNGSQENAMAYVINVPKIMAGNVVVEQGSVLGGAAFFGGLFSIGLLGWLLIILLILLIILIARSYAGNRRISSETVTHTTTH